MAVHCFKQHRVPCIFLQSKKYSVIKVHVRYKVTIYSVQYNIVKFSVDCMIASSLLRLQLKKSVTLICLIDVGKIYQLLRLIQSIK